MNILPLKKENVSKFLIIDATAKTALFAVWKIRLDYRRPFINLTTIALQVLFLLKISLNIPDEKARRVGQSVAAASLPQVK